MRIFDFLAKESDSLIPQMFPTSSRLYDITNDNNLIQFEDGNLALWGLKS